MILFWRSCCIVSSSSAACGSKPTAMPATHRPVVDWKRLGCTSRDPGAMRASGHSVHLLRCLQCQTGQQTSLNNQRTFQAVVDNTIRQEI